MILNPAGENDYPLFGLVSVSRQLQQQQQAELDRGGSGDGLYEAGPIALSQVSLLPHL